MFIEEDILRMLIEATGRYLREARNASITDEQILLAYECAVFENMRKKNAEKLRKTLEGVA